MKQELEMDDLRVGMYVTILYGGTTTGMNGEPCERHDNRGWKGIVLEIIAINFPYIVVIAYPLIHSQKTVNKVLDFREVKLMQLSKQYVKKLCPDLDLSKDNFWDDISDKELEVIDVTIDEAFNKTSTE